MENLKIINCHKRCKDLLQKSRRLREREFQYFSAMHPYKIWSIDKNVISIMSSKSISIGISNKFFKRFSKLPNLTIKLEEFCTISFFVGLSSDTDSNANTSKHYLIKNLIQIQMTTPAQISTKSANIIIIKINIFTVFPYKLNDLDSQLD